MTEEEQPKEKSFMTRMGEKAWSGLKLGAKVAAGAAAIGGVALGVKKGYDTYKKADAAAVVAKAVADEAPAAVKHKLNPFKPAKKNKAKQKIDKILAAAKKDPIAAAKAIKNPPPEPPKPPSKKEVKAQKKAEKKQAKAEKKADKKQVKAEKKAEKKQAKAEKKPGKVKGLLSKLDKRDESFKEQKKKKKKKK